MKNFKITLLFVSFFMLTDSLQASSKVRIPLKKAVSLAKSTYSTTAAPRAVKSVESYKSQQRSAATSTTSHPAKISTPTHSFKARSASPQRVDFNSKSFNAKPQQAPLVVETSQPIVKNSSAPINFRSGGLRNMSPAEMIVISSKFRQMNQQSPQSVPTSTLHVATPQKSFAQKRNAMTGFAEKHFAKQVQNRNEYVAKQVQKKSIQDNITNFSKQHTARQMQNKLVRENLISFSEQHTAKQSQRNLQAKASKRTSLLKNELASAHKTRQQRKEKYDLQEFIINDAVSKASKKIDRWTENYGETASNTYVQSGLKEDLLSSLLTKDKSGNFKVNDPKIDRVILERLSAKYQKNKNVHRVLRKVTRTVNETITSQQVYHKQANGIIARYYTPEMRNEIFTFLNKKPTYDSTGAVTNMPTVEMLIKEVQMNPSPQGLKALKTAQKATKVAVYAFRQNTSMLGDGPLLSQLKAFEKTITTSLQNPRFTQPQSWGSYAASFVPSTQTVLSTTGLGNVTTSQAVGAGKKVLDLTNSFLNLTGYDKATVNQVAEKTGAISSKTKVKENKTTPSKGPRELTDFQQRIKAVNEKHAKQDKAAANQAVDQYYTPEMKREVLSIMPRKESGSRSSTSTPLVEKVMEQAMAKPNKKSFDALQSTLEATQVAIFASKGNKSLTKQLETYKSQIKSTLENPNFNQFQSWSTHATSYAKEFIPSTKTTLNATGVGNATTSQAVGYGKKALEYVDSALYVTGQGKTTMNEMLGYN